MQKSSKLRILSLCIIAYMMLAFSWWSILLFINNQDAFEAKSQLLQVGMAAEKLIDSPADFYKSEEYLALHDEYRRQKLMILGEAIVFIITLVIGIYLVNKSYQREIESAKQQRNFLLSITHELKSPLAGIRLSLETIQKRELNRELTKKLSTNAITETSRLTNLVEDLLLSAKLDSHYEPNLEPLSINQVCSTWVNRMKNKYQHICFDTSIPKTDITILADHYGINSVLSNLLENAVKYIGSGDKILLSLTETDKNVVLSIADNGLGIPEIEKKKVFNKFYRVGNEDTRSTKGTGLGLYIVNEVVRAHQGYVKLTDNQPQGTNFSIHLPFG